MNDSIITDSGIIISQIRVHSWNFERIERDFDIYRLSMDGPFNQNILDADYGKAVILSTVYYSCQQCFVMTRKSRTDEQELRLSLNRAAGDGTHSCSVSKIDLPVVSGSSRKLRELFGYRGRALLQLLINSTLNAVFPENDYNNITGRCYYWNSQWNDTGGSHIELVDLTIQRDMVIYPSVITFLRADPKSPRSGRCVVLDPDSNVIRRAMNGDTEVYCQQGIDGTHSTRQYDGTDLRNWERSRLSCMARFYREVRSALEPYADFRFTRVDARKVAVRSLTRGLDGELALLKADGVNLVNSAFTSEEETEKSRAWVRDSSESFDGALEELCRKYGIPFTRGQKDFYRLNVELVRHPKYYSHYKLPDIYSDDRNTVTQHMIVPFPSKGSFLQNAVETIIKELAVKAELRNGRFDMVDWTSFGITRPLTFFSASAIGEKEQRQIILKGMTVMPDGSFTTERYQFFERRYFDENERVRAVYDCFLSSSSGGRWLDRSIELAVFPESMVGDAYLIRRTNIRAMSDVEAMERSFMDEKADVILDAERVIDAVSPLQDDPNPNNVTVYWNIVDELRNLDTIRKSRLLPLLVMPSERTGRRVVLCRKARCLIENAMNVVIRVGRSGEDEQRLGTSAYRHIHLWRMPEYDDAEGQPDVYWYTVGHFDSLKQSQATAPVVRQIMRCDRSEPDEQFVMSLIGMMQVSFVKMGDYTVLPFPAKYLREM